MSRYGFIVDISSNGCYVIFLRNRAGCSFSHHEHFMLERNFIWSSKNKLVWFKRNLLRGAEILSLAETKDAGIFTKIELDGSNSSSGWFFSWTLLNQGSIFWAKKKNGSLLPEKTDLTCLRSSMRKAYSRFCKDPNIRLTQPQVYEGSRFHDAQSTHAGSSCLSTHPC